VALPWYDNQSLGTLVAVISAVPLAFGFAIGVKWRAMNARGIRVRTRRVCLTEEFYKHRSSRGQLYEYRYRLKLAPGLAVSSAVERSAHRAVLVDSMPERDRLEALARADQWAWSAGKFAESASGLRPMPLRGFLGTYHLGLVREGFLAEPFLVWSIATGKAGLDRPGDEVRIWALALRDRAARYNAVTRHQRKPVYFAGDDASAVGIVLPAPPRWRRPDLSFVDCCSPSFRLFAWRFWIARHRLRQTVHLVQRLIAEANSPSI